MPKFTPKKDEELVSLLQEGEGQFHVISAIEETSKKGDPMIKLILECWDNENRKSTIFDYLIFNNNIFCERKTKNFCYASGLEKEYESGQLNSFDCNSKEGNCLIGIKRDKSGQYPDKSCINDYIKRDLSDIKNNTNDLNDSLEDINF